MDEFVQCYTSKKKKSQKFHKDVVGFFFLFETENYFQVLKLVWKLISLSVKNLI